MITVPFIALLLLSVVVAAVDWRRGWLLAVLCGVLQDPARKLAVGSPVEMTMSIIAVYLMVLFSARATLQDHARAFSKRFGLVKMTAAVVLIFMFVAAMNGLATFGVNNWKAPALAAFIYCAPIPAVLLGFTWLQREEQIYGFFRFYAAITSVAMVGTVMEYLDIPWRALGTVSMTEGNFRYLPGITVRLLSGFYRAPDIMGWHAATLTIIGIAMTIRARVLRETWPWMIVTGWGFLNCLISGRRKAVYMVAVFAAAFLLRYARRLRATQVAAIAIAALALFIIVLKLGQNENASAYTRSSATSGEEIFSRLEGGMVETIRQFGVMGGGLGTATQGVYHIITFPPMTLGWQEGGLAKLTMELGVPGLVAVLLFGGALLSFMLKASRHPDVRGSSQFLRAALFGIVIADVAEFFVSAQAYSDAVLTLLSAFFLGCLFASSLLDERLKKVEAPAPLVLGPARVSSLPA
jgi:hypothetical protein